MVNFLLSLATNTFDKWFANKQETDKLKLQARINNANHHMAGYSDEFLILVWSYPFISMFFDFSRPTTIDAFEKIGLLPEWYIGGFISISFAVFGIDKFFKWRLSKPDNKKGE
jgi:hypothetical protein